jgi:hypothetical protein
MPKSSLGLLWDYWIYLSELDSMPIRGSHSNSVFAFEILAMYAVNPFRLIRILHDFGTTTGHLNYRFCRPKILILFSLPIL